MGGVTDLDWAALHELATAPPPVEHADALAWLVEREPESATAIVYDPPYAIGTNSVRGKDDGAAGSISGPLSFMQRTMALCARALRPGGIAIVFCDHRRIPDLMYAATTSGLRYAATVAWVHNQPSTGGIFRASWNPVLVFSRGTPDRVDRSAKADGRDVIEAKRVSKRSHPHQKPAAVYEHILARVCRPGDLVLNPFAGSASSREAAEKLGLRWAAATWTPPTRRRARA